MSDKPSKTSWIRRISRKIILSQIKDDIENLKAVYEAGAKAERLNKATKNKYKYKAEALESVLDILSTYEP